MERIPVANRPKGLALLENRVWFAVQASGSGHRGGRLVVGAGLIDGSIDPNFISWAGTGDSLSATYDGLVAVARRGGSEGTQIVPNLAENLPVITNGETRYAFQLRRGVRYSNGAHVKASDFRRALERSFRAGADPRDVPLVGILGLHAATAKSSGLRAGASRRTTKPERSSFTFGDRSGSASSSRTT